MTDILYIDSNEPTKVQTTVAATIKDRDTGASTETKGLKTADFVYKDVAIERKEASDLASSIKSRRLKEQTVRMREDFNHQYIIIEGNPYTLEYSSLHDNSFIGTMVSRSSEGIGIIYTPDVEGTAYAINKIISKHDEGEEKTEELKKTHAETEDITVAMLTCIEGISKEKAEAITEELDMPSIASMFQWLETLGEGQFQIKLQEVDGIGPTLAGRILSSLKFGVEDTEA